MRVCINDSQLLIDLIMIMKIMSRIGSEVAYESQTTSAKFTLDTNQLSTALCHVKTRR